ncbi:MULTISPECIES: orotidine-5'-phosphate decarboxylase [Brevibacillus]|uniref:orotidine-5'-phosphate decarboxylase n=1 Tax=Brevibacillus TaxID=55080 RepID=UPI000D104611|nr:MULTISPECIES: orotidine-5'-phosphate decarboxylase [Brevibacillus]MED1947434.1 orotidine-5'-phosphate decarboxylase [Brevibacillus formosus]MED1997299.1 orotidine-5'-phosphate decarboxylase [Brevibacillus formosus]MED2083156.1 orotidine-5'-phosphate decarboxylase [Brevibacillus formosus]PSK17020.1 orotidine-5'-phosphate decarboxylase [Brevibacillus sp. NRRL NRS-603]
MQQQLTDIRERMIVALDFSTLDEVKKCIDPLQGHIRYVKVGMELAYAEGPAIVSFLKEKGLNVFLDLKVHDIPNTAKGAMRNLARLGADMVNVHAAGGVTMMAAAREGLEQGTAAGAARPLLIGVTMLTSTGLQTMNQELAIPGAVEDVVVHYAMMTKQAGLDGVVASPLEVPMIKKAAGDAFITVTPGIRPLGADQGDQTRITTPEQAFRLGSDFIVIGRAITGAKDPVGVWESIVAAVEKDRS